MPGIGNEKVVDDIPGFWCSGYQLEASRLIFQTPISLEEASRIRDDPHDDRMFYGYDQTMNIAEATGGYEWRPLEGFNEKRMWRLSCLLCLFLC